jgi:hypothetical protein
VGRLCGVGVGVGELLVFFWVEKEKKSSTNLYNPIPGPN